MPRVSYVSLLDVWMVVCIFFVFLSIGEFIVVSALIRAGHKVGLLSGDYSRIGYFGIIWFCFQILAFYHAWNC